MLKFIAPLLAVLVLIVLPLWMIARRAKAGKERQKAALCQYLRLLPRHVRNGGGVPWAGASLRRTTRPRSPRLPAARTGPRPSVTWRRRWPSASRKHSLGHRGLELRLRGHRRADRNEGSFGKSIVFVGMAEGIAIYGLLIAIVILLF